MFNKREVKKLGRKLNALCNVLGYQNYTDYEHLEHGNFYYHENVNAIRKEEIENINRKVDILEKTMIALIKYLDVSVIEKKGLEVVKNKKQ